MGVDIDVNCMLPGVEPSEGQGQFLSVTCLVKDFTKGQAEVASACMDGQACRVSMKAVVSLSG